MYSYFRMNYHVFNGVSWATQTRSHKRIDQNLVSVVAYLVQVGLENVYF